MGKRKVWKYVLCNSELRLTYILCAQKTLTHSISAGIMKSCCEEALMFCVMFLMQATSALDSVSERLVQGALDRLMKVWITLSSCSLWCEAGN